MKDGLGPLPDVRVDVVEDRSATAPADRGFLRLRRLSLRNAYPDGTESRTYDYDIVERDALDAVGIVLAAPGPRICLRSALRPPLAFRAEYDVPVHDDAPPVLWEIPAGLVEPGEIGEAGVLACAARETLEEVGLEVEATRFTRLGPAACLSPGVLGEKVHFVVADVDPAAAAAPEADGSVVEERAEVRWVLLDEALAATRDGRIGDVKTEVAIRRLVERGSRG
jgi:ADP-ribose pyrophosphatase